MKRSAFGSMISPFFHTLPAFTLVLLALIDGILSPAFLEINLNLTLVGLYYWLIYRPDLISPLFLLILGLFQANLEGSPLGYSSFVLLLIYGISLTQRRHFIGKSFYMVWAGFVFVFICSQLLEWLWVVSSVKAYILPENFLFETFLTLFSYPPIAFSLFKTLAWLPRKL